jgi:hypothetical protein
LDPGGADLHGRHRGNLHPVLQRRWSERQSRRPHRQRPDLGGAAAGGGLAAFGRLWRLGGAASASAVVKAALYREPKRVRTKKGGPGTLGPFSM